MSIINNKRKDRFGLAKTDAAQGSGSGQVLLQTKEKINMYD
jgi:hypothetical protein